MQNKIPVILVLGNCQSRTLSHFLASIPEIHTQYEVKWFRNFVIRKEANHKAVLTEYLEQNSNDIELIICQAVHDWGGGSLDRKLLSPKTKVITYPVAHLNYIWPFTIREANDEAFGDRPFPRFPHNILDANIVALAEKGVSAENIVEEYMNIDITKTYNLDRIKTLMSAKMKQVDEMADFPIFDYIDSRIQDEQVFRTTSHPNGPLLGHIFKEIFERTDIIKERDILAGKLRDVAQGHGIQSLDAPVHPEIAKHFGLKWAIDGKFKFWNEGEYSFKEYLSKLYTRKTCAVFLKAIQVQGKGDHNKAIEMLNQALVEVPQNAARINMLLSKSYSKLKDHPQALKHARLAHELEPIEAYKTFLVKTLWGAGEKDECSALMESTNDVANSSAETIIAHVVILRAQKRLEEALQLLDTAIAKNPHLYTLYKFKGDILSKSANVEFANQAYKTAEYVSCGLYKAS